MTDLYAVFGRASEEVGIGLFGTTRALIHLRDGALVTSDHVQLDQLPATVARLKRDDFSLVMGEAMYNEKQHCFSTQHPDFKEKSYFAFVFASQDVQADVERMQRIADGLIRTDMRVGLMNWLRSLDNCTNTYVAPRNELAFALVLSEFARENERELFTAFPGVPNTKPSSDGGAWKKWLQSYFSEKDVDSTFGTLNWPLPSSLTISPFDPNSTLDLLRFSL